MRSAPFASVVIPAHNEETSIVRLLERLAVAVSTGQLEVVVVCNGCTDGTAEVARGAAPGVLVVETATPSKAEALRLGDEHTRAFPRAYVDADVVIDVGSLRRLAAALCEVGVLASAPERRLDRTQTSRVVRWYYDVWERLPQVREGLFGRGVVMVGREGFARIRALPPAMSDDLVMSEAFRSGERRVVDGATVLIRLPRTTADLIRRRIRVVTGNSEAQQSGLRGGAAKTTVGSLLQLAGDDRVVAARLPVFVAVSLVARWRASGPVRHQDDSTWLRDDSSRE